MARRRDDDPFDDLFREIERLMVSVMGADADVSVTAGGGTDNHVAVHEYDDRLVVIADLPGVSDKEQIDLKCTGRTLSIRAAGRNRSYADRVRLPARIDQASASASYNNGVLEVELERSDDSANIDVR